MFFAKRFPRRRRRSGPVLVGIAGCHPLMRWFMIDEISEQKTGLTINALPDALPVEEMVGEDAVCSTVCDSNLKSVSTPPVL